MTSPSAKARGNAAYWQRMAEGTYKSAWKYRDGAPLPNNVPEEHRNALVISFQNIGANASAQARRIMKLEDA